MLTDGEYRELTRQRDKLVEIGKSVRVMKHKKMVEEQLTDIRNKLKDAHYEQYHNRNNS
jgi:hypothetical protein